MSETACEEVMKKLSPTPLSLPPRTEDIDDSWGEDEKDPPRAALPRPPESAAPSISSHPLDPLLLDIEPTEMETAPPVPLESDLVLELDGEPGSPLDLADRVESAPEAFPVPAAFEPSMQNAGNAGDIVREMRDRYAVGDFTGALMVAESVLSADPENENALRYASSCRDVLTQMYSARLGSLDQLVTVTIPPEQITWLSLDHRAGFLLSLVDGVSSIEEILDVSGMNRLEAMRIMFTLVQQNIVALG